jgi:hypothetical protein
MATSSYLISDFAYQPLDLARTQVRLIRILDGLPGSSIQCELWHTDLGEEHTCLSYMCGDDEPAYAILVNGRKLLVRNNLSDFLADARDRRFRMPLWIDAICLNQSNVVERNHQVQQMWRIYASAAEILVWAGKLPSSLVDICRTVNDLHERIEALQQRQDLRRPTRKYSVDAVSATDGQNVPTRSITWGQKIFSGLHDFLETRRLRRQLHARSGWPTAVVEVAMSPYWSRLWIVQEIMLGKDTRVVAASGTIPLKDIAACLRAMSVTHEWTLKRLTEEESEALRRLETMCTWSLYYFRGSSQMNFVNVLSTFGYALCSEERDKIYGLFGLSPETREIAVNYGQSTHAMALRIAFDLVTNANAFAERSSNVMDLLVHIAFLANTLSVWWMWMCDACFQTAPKEWREALASPIQTTAPALDTDNTEIFVFAASRSFAFGHSDWAIDVEFDVCPFCQKQYTWKGCAWNVPEKVKMNEGEPAMLRIVTNAKPNYCGDCRTSRDSEAAVAAASKVMENSELVLERSEKALQEQSNDDM